MHFLIVSHAAHKIKDNRIYSYAPYVREMNLWLKYADEVSIVAPKTNEALNAIDLNYNLDKSIQLKAIPFIEFTSVKHSLISLFKLPVILWTIFKACKKADHIHLRCPGNIGLLGCFIQVFFPRKSKTAKYAGNWDPKAVQPKSYKLQKWLLSNTFFTKKMQVLVYGDWQKQSRNIKSFFTATYTNLEIETPVKRDYNAALEFVFVGSLVEGKRPLLAIKIVEALYKQGRVVNLDLFGDGMLKPELQDYITNNNLEACITLHGNQDKEVVKQALKKAHFLILASKSEGWPKAVAEAMFFGVIPIVTKISCVPYMLDYGKRGVLIAPELNSAVDSMTGLLKNTDVLQLKAESAVKWSQYYTLDLFESDISKLVKTE